MKTLSKLAIGAALALLVAVSIQPVQASCNTPYIIDSGSIDGNSAIVSNPNWCFEYGCYTSEGGPPISPSFRAFFWAIGTGNPAIGLGDDSGAFHSSQWANHRTSEGGSYFYNAYLNVGGGTLHWQAPGIDGCVNNAGATMGIDGTECTCLLFSDAWGDQAYYAVLSARSSTDGTNSYRVFRPGAAPYLMATVPKPNVINSVKSETTNNLTFTVALSGGLSAANFEKDGCDCGLSYKVYANVRPRQSAPPASRDIATGGWVEVSPTATAAGDTTTFEVNCGAVDTDVYLGTVLTTSDGFTATHVSTNGSRAECGPTIADPVQRPSRPIDTPQRPRPGVGKGGR